MSGKVVQLHQLMEHEALSIETDFSSLKDNELKAYLATGESLSSLKTALTRGDKLLLLNKPKAPMFIMDFPKAELSTEDRVKIILHSLKPMQVRQAHPAINTAYPKDVIKAIDARLGTAGGMINIGGNPYQSPSSGNLHPPAEMPKRTKEPLVADPKSEPPKKKVADTFAMAPNRLIFKLVYDDKEQTKAANVPYTVIMEDGKNTQITGTLDKHGKAEVQPNTNHAAFILFGDEALAAEAQNTLDNAYTKLDNAINNKAKQSAQHAFDKLNQQQSQQQKVPVTQAFADAVNHKLDELNQQSQAFNNQSFLSQSWDMAKAAQSGAASGVTEYLPDLGDFGDLLDAADINVTMLIEAIATGDVDALEDKFQAWKERGKQGMWEACDTMEMLILLLSDSQGRELIASLPARMLAALPPDKVVEMSAYHVTQLGMDTAVVSGGTAVGTLAGGVGGPIACASLLLAANGRKAGKVLEETVEVLGEMKDALKVVRNNNTKKQLYKKDPSIPNHEADLNTRTFVTPLKENKQNNKHKEDEDKTHKCDWKDCKGKHKKPIHYPNNGVIKRDNVFAKKWVKAGLEPWVIYGAGKDTKATKEEYQSITKKMSDVNKAVNMQHPEYPTQKHHLISIKLFNNVLKLKHNAKLAGYDVNHHKNGICLPAFKFDIAQHDLQCHRGNHSNDHYYDKIAPYLKDIEKEIKKSCKNKNDYKQQSQEVISELNELSNDIKKNIISWKYLLRKKALEERELAIERIENIYKN
ncbi:AHH domain-containing protein [uncultured Shewanella sp.]|uniref:AHH domain-containing protein n=4 Tax=uncultured Shewanella sp. TaxID=173975 RepID=UPI00260AB847|nr:AHH domain-containing protein [uncultured Shewanella sp.]